MPNADTKLQLIIEAINRTEATFNKVKRDLQDLQATTTGVSASGQQLEEAGKKGAGGMQQFHDHAQRSYSMMGNLVQMALLFGSISFAAKLAESGIEYNKALEISKLGIAAIMTSMGIITNQQGQALSGQEKWNAAQQLSVEAQRELQRIAMTTPATYEELVQAYQGLLAPALAAKLNFQETLELTGLITNSVKSMGMPIQQIVQEGRDLVAGTIDQNSQLARSLQISNDDVKKWREKGIVFQEIKKRLEGFIFASRDFEDTWEGTWSNFKDIAQRALGEGSEPLFAYIKGELVKLTRDMVNVTKDANGNYVDIQIKPEVIAKIRELARELEKLVAFLEGVVNWGSKLAEPALLAGIAIGIDKITRSVKALATAAESGALARLISSLPALAAVAGLWAGKQYADAKGLSDEASDIRLRAKVDNDHQSARMRAMGINNLQNIDEFGWRELQSVRQKLPTADHAQIATMLRQGIISLQKEGIPGFDKEWRIVPVVDEEAAKKFLEGRKSGNTLTGSNKKTAEEIKKENNEKRAAIEDDYKGQIERIKRGEMEKVEAYKTGLKEKELLFQKGQITEEELLKAQADSQKKSLQAGIDAITSQQGKLTEEWNAKKDKYNDPAERSKGHKEYVTEWYRLDDEKKKKSAELSRSLTDEEIKQIEHRRQVETAQREGDLKLVQEKLAEEKQVNQLLLEREKISPYEAEKRSIANEQSGLEAEYWNTFAKTRQGGLGTAQLKELNTQLAVIEQKLAQLDKTAPDRLYKAGKETGALDAKREEARISHELADLDEKDKLREIPKATALQKRKDLLNDLLKAQEKAQQSVDPTDTTAWNSQQAAIDGTRQKITEVDLEMREFSNDLAGGLRDGFLSYIDSVGGGFKQMQGLAAETAQAMQQSFSDFFFDAMQGKLKTFKDYLNSFLTSVERSIANVLAQRMVVSALGGLGLGFRAEGGPVTAGQPYIVGEKGLELFIPQSSGTIVPNHALSKSSPGAVGGSKTIVVDVGGVSVQQTGGGGDMDVTRAAELGKMIHGAIKQTIIQEQRPGGLLY